MVYNNGTCDSDANKCRSQIELNKLMKDPILGPFLTSRAPNYADNSSITKLGGHGWISLSTTSASGLNESKARLNAKDENINFFAVKRYIPEDSKVVYNALKQSMSSGKGNGNNIIFDKYGNFAYWDGVINKILYNPIVPTNDNISAALIASVRNNTLAVKCKDYIRNTNIYYYNKKMIANPAMTYFILTTDQVPSENSIYYLVYNPIHRMEFLKYYTNLLGYEGIWAGSNLTKTDNGVWGGYQNTQVSTVPSTTGGLVIEAPSYKTTVARYCNAIKIGGDTLQNGKRAEHYADPTCTFIMDKDDSKFSLVTGKNFTQSNLAYDKYVPTNGTAEEGNARFLSSKNTLLSTAGNNQVHWPCHDSWDNNHTTPFKYAQEFGLFGDNSESFVNVLGNAYLNHFRTTLSSVNRSLNIGGSGFSKSPTCDKVSQQLISCTAHVDIAGNAIGNDLDMQFACGVVPDTAAVAAEAAAAAVAAAAGAAGAA